MEIKLSQSGKKASTFSLLKENIVLGSGSDCDLIVDHPEIAEKHLLLIQHKDGRVTIKDLAGGDRTTINEVGIQKDEEIEFTTFFPAQLGKNFTLELLNMTESERKTCVMVLDRAVKFNDAPSVAQEVKPAKKLSSTSSPGSRTITTLSSGPSKNSPKSAPAKTVKKAIPSEFDDFDDDDEPKKSSNSMAMILGILSMAFGVYYFMNDGKLPFLDSNSQGQNVETATQVEAMPGDNMANGQGTKTAIVDSKVGQTFIDELILSANSIVMKEKCLAPQEKEVCDYMNSLRSTDYYEGAIYKDGVLLVIINYEMASKFVANQFELTPDIKESFKDSARKVMNTHFANRLPQGTNMFEFIEKKIQQMDAEGNFKLYNLPEGRTSELALTYYLLNQEMLNRVTNKDYINFLVGICFNRKGGQPAVTAVSAISMNKIRNGGVNQEVLKRALLKGLVGGIFEDYERDYKGFFDQTKDFSPGMISYVGPDIKTEDLRPSGTNGFGGGPNGAYPSNTPTSNTIYYSPSQSGR